jgi:hypothetical protein
MVSRKRMSSKQKQLIAAHVDEVHPNQPFDFQQDVPKKVASLQGAADFKAVVQEVLWTSFHANPITLDCFEESLSQLLSNY